MKDPEKLNEVRRDFAQKVCELADLYDQMERLEDRLKFPEWGNYGAEWPKVRLTVASRQTWGSLRLAGRIKRAVGLLWQAAGRTQGKADAAVRIMWDRRLLDEKETHNWHRREKRRKKKEAAKCSS